MQPEECLVEELKKRGLTVSTAESLTGGMIGARIVNVSGASEVFGYGFITYANEAKMSELYVKPETLAAYTAVSAETAREMVIGAVKHAGSDTAIAVTGLAGPDGGTPEKPVGLVYIAVSAGNDILVTEQHFSGSRLEIRTQTAETAMRLLTEQIRKHDSI